MDFRQQHARADGVHGSGRDEDAIAGPRGEGVQTVFDASGFAGLLERLRIDARFESHVEQAVGQGVEDHPGFGFSIFVRVDVPGPFVVGMHLDRQPVRGVKKLDKKWKLPAFALLLPQKGHAFFRHQPGKGPPLKFAGRDDALVGSEVDNLPAFGVIGFRAEGFMESRSQPAASPANAFEDGIKLKRQHQQLAWMEGMWNVNSGSTGNSVCVGRGELVIFRPSIVSQARGKRSPRSAEILVAHETALNARHGGLEC